MKRLPLILAVILLLLAPAVPARGGELDAHERAVQDAAAKVELLLAELDQTQDPEQRAVLEERIAAARTEWEHRKAELAMARAAHQTLRNRYALVGAQVKEVMARLSALHDEAEARSKALADRGDAKAKELYAPYLARVTRSLGEAYTAAETLERIAAAIEAGDVAGAGETLAEAETRAAYVKQLIAEAEAQRQRVRQALDARRAVEAGNRLREGATSGAAEIAAKRAELERLRAQAAKLQEEATRFETDRANVGEARPQLDTPFEPGKRPVEDGEASPEALDGVGYRVRSGSSDAARLRQHLEQMEKNVQRMRELGIDEDHPGLKSALRQIEAMRKRIERAEGTSDRPFHTAVRFSGARRAILESAIAEKEAQLAVLRTTHTDQHPDVVRLKQEIEALKLALAASGDESGLRLRAGHVDPATLQEAELKGGKQPGDAVRWVADEDGRFVIVGEEDDRISVRGRIVGDGHVVVEGDVAVEGEASEDEDADLRPVEVVPHHQQPLRVLYSDGKITYYGPEGQVIRKLAEAQRPVTVTKSVQGTYRYVGGPPDPKLEKQIESLKKAAKLLREAGQVEEAERLEKKQKELEARRPRYTVVSPAGVGNAQVLKAIQDLRTDVRALREEVRELKALILKGR